MALYVVTLAEIKAELGIADSADDANLTRLVEGLQGRFEEHLERWLSRVESAEEVVDGGGRFLLLRRFPTESVASVTVLAGSDGSDGYAIDADDYRLVAARGRLVSVEGPWPAGVANIRVVHTGGYVAAGTTPTAGQTAMPEGIRRALFMQAGFEWRNRENLGKSGVSAQGASVSLAPAKLLPEVVDTMAAFRRL